MFWAMDMDETTLRTLRPVRQSCGGMVAANMNAALRCGFGNFHCRFIAWMADVGCEANHPCDSERDPFLINILGVWRWLPRAEKEATGQKPVPASSFVKD